VCNCFTDERRPLGTGLQEQVPNHLWRLRAKAVVVSAEEQAWKELGQVTGKKRTVKEPLMTCRKRRDDVRTAGESLLRDQLRRNLFTDGVASGIKVA
jgi:hypothetical protein